MKKPRPKVAEKPAELAFPVMQVTLLNEAWEPLTECPEIFTRRLQLGRFLERWYDYRVAHLQLDPDADQCALAMVAGVELGITMETSASIDRKTDGGLGVQQ